MILAPTGSAKAGEAPSASELSTATARTARMPRRVGWMRLRSATVAPPLLVVSLPLLALRLLPSFFLVLVLLVAVRLVLVRSRLRPAEIGAGPIRRQRRRGASGAMALVRRFAVRRGPFGREAAADASVV